MKKVSVRFVILCILALLVGASALAVGVRVSNLKTQNADVEVKTLTSETGDPIFSITMKNAESGKPYTVLIRSGAEEDKPSGGDKGNLVYMDVVEAKDGVLSVNKAYPKEMTNGTYRVFISDYGKKAIRQAATFEVNNGGEKPDTTVKLGDVNGDDSIDVMDAIAILDHAAEIPGKDLSSKMNVADINKDDSIDVMDAIIVLDHAAEIYDLQEKYGV